MKKKIKELTLKEVNNIFHKHECKNCPLYDLSYCFLLGVENERLPRRYLNKKIEVEDESSK